MHHSETSGNESPRSETTSSSSDCYNGVVLTATEEDEILSVREKDMSCSLTFEARIGDARLRVLADTGAKGMYIDAEVAKKLGLTVKDPSQPIQVGAAGNTPLQYYGTTEFALDFGSFRDKATTYKIVGLGEPYDVILGREFWWQYKAAIHYETGGLWITLGSRSVLIFPIAQQSQQPDSSRIYLVHEPEIQFCSPRSVRKVLRKRKDACLWIVKENSITLLTDVVGDELLPVVTEVFAMVESKSNHLWASTGNRELDDKLGALRRILRQELPNELPPKRAVEHGINTG